MVSIFYYWKILLFFKNDYKLNKSKFIIIWLTPLNYPILKSNQNPRSFFIFYLNFQFKLSIIVSENDKAKWLVIVDIVFTIS